jgi:hypothetical protein
MDVYDSCALAVVVLLRYYRGPCALVRLTDGGAKLSSGINIGVRISLWDGTHPYVQSVLMSKRFSLSLEREDILTFSI